VTVREAIRDRHLRGDRDGRDRLLAYALRNGASYRQLAEVIGCFKACKAEIVGSVLDEPVPGDLDPPALIPNEEGRPATVMAGAHDQRPGRP
jgi:hypothetical protein